MAYSQFAHRPLLSMRVQRPLAGSGRTFLLTWSTRHSRLSAMKFLWIGFTLSTINIQSIAQNAIQAGKPEDQGFTLHQDVQEVLLYCTVLDSKGNIVTDLDRSAFKVRESK